jgi:two-component system, sensor histidine kinase and response regulator
VSINQSRDSQKKRILVVDDLDDNLFFMQMFLESEGYQVETASNGKQALTKIWEAPPDLVLLDVMMPDLDGYEVTRQIRQNSALPFIPILLVTAHGDLSASRGLDLGANDFVRKPVDVDELLARVRSFIRIKHELNS